MIASPIADLCRSVMRGEILSDKNENKIEAPPQLL